MADKPRKKDRSEFLPGQTGTDEYDAYERAYDKEYPPAAAARQGAETAGVEGNPNYPGGVKREGGARGAPVDTDIGKGDLAEAARKRAAKRAAEGVKRVSGS